MALKITHPFVSGKADGGDTTEVKPSDWNHAHDVATDGAGGMVVGRDTSGPGALQELPLAYDAVAGIGRWVANVVGSFRLPRGTTGQRTAAPVDGEMRFNIDLNYPEVYMGGAWVLFNIGAFPIATGDLTASLAAAKTGWLLLNGQTIGPVGSGATYANATAQALFNLMWAINANTWPIVPGRGADAAADWAALKTIALPDARGCVLGMVDLAAGINALLVNLGVKVGIDKKPLDITNIPAHTHKGPSWTGVGGFGGAARIVVNNDDGAPTGATGGDPLAVPAFSVPVPVPITQPTMGANIFVKL